MGERDTPKDGWLAEQIADAKDNIASWPKGYADGLSMAGADLNELAILRAEVVRLREALRPFVDGNPHTRVFLTTREKMHRHGVELWDEDVARARAALEDSNG